MYFLLLNSKKDYAHSSYALSFNTVFITPRPASE